MKINNWPKLIDFAADRLGYTIVDKQEDVLKSTKQVKVIRAARRTGKSFNVALITYSLLCYSQATSISLNIIFAGPRSEDTRHMWSHLHSMLESKPIQGMTVEYDNYLSQSTAKKKMFFSNGTRITNATCDNPEMDDIRGDAYDFLAVDEYGNIDYKKEFMAAASQALKDQDRLNMMMVIGTPDLGMGEEFDSLFEVGQKEEENIQSWHLTEADCPFIDKESADVMNSLLDEDGRLREVEGLQVPPGGKLFPEFNYRTQVTPQAYDIKLPYFIGVDFGRNKPVVEFIQADGDDFRVFHEISCNDILVENLVKEIELAVLVKCFGNQPTIIGCDKAGKAKSDLVSYTAYSVLHKAFPMATFTTSVQLVNKDNQTGLYRRLTMNNRIWIDPSCKKLTTAFIKATPNTSGKRVNSGWKKVEGIDDPLDAFMYGLINFDPGLIIASKPPTKVPSDFEVQMALSRL